MPKYLGQIVAIEKDVRRTTAQQIVAAQHPLQAPAMLEGISREYQPRDDDGEQLPSEGVRVQATVKEMIDATRDALVRLFDVSAARDYTNASSEAVADVRVDGETLIEAAPVPYLLWLEKQLSELEAFVRRLPTHDPSTEWTLENPRGVYKSAPVQTARQVQQPRSRVVVPATDHHPAQVQAWQENVMVGTWTTVKHTGAIPVADQAKIVARIHALQRAVHLARAEANRVEAQEPQVGARVLEYIFG